MDLKTETNTNYGALQSVFAGNRAKALLDYAVRQRDFLERTVCDGTAERHAAAAYVLQLYHHASTFSDEPARDESYQIVSLLMGMEAIRSDCWAYGSKLIYDLKIAGIDLTRDEVSAFLAQEGTWENNKYDKGKLLEGNSMAVAFYCAQLLTLYGSLTGKNPGLPQNDTDPGILKRIEGCYGNSVMETIENLLKTFGPAYLGEGSESVLAAFMIGIRKIGFYTAPASTKYHLAEKEGLAKHSFNVFVRQIELERPTDDATVGKCIIAAVCHDLCKCMFYTPTWNRAKVYIEDGQGKFKEPDGKSYEWQDVLQYRIDDKLPFGHGRKSLYISVGYFKNLLTEEVACAIEAHMGDFTKNPMIGYQFLQYPFALRLHIADVLASQLDEAEG